MKRARPKKTPTRTAKRKPTHTKRVPRVAHGAGREALLEAVVRAVARQGTEGFSYRAIAREAGLTHGLLNYYFGSRDRMLAEACMWALNTELREMQLQPGATWVEDFTRNVITMQPHDEDKHLFLNELVLDACRGGRRRKEVAHVYDEVFGVVKAALESSGVRATPALSRVVFSILAGLTVQHMAFRSPAKTRAGAAELLRIVDLLRRAG